MLTLVDEEDRKRCNKEIYEKIEKIELTIWKKRLRLRRLDNKLNKK